MKIAQVTRVAGFNRASAVYIWIAVIVLFAVWIPSRFLTLGTLHSLAAEQAVPAILALGLLVPMAAGAYDLSVGAVANLSAVLVALLQTQHGLGMWPAIFISVGAGALVGAVNGFLVVVIRINSFIVTLATSTIVLAVQEIISGINQPTAPTSNAWSDLALLQVLGFPIVVIYMLILAVIAWWFMDRTPAGRNLHVIGGNPEAARLAGVQVGGWTWGALVISGTVSGIAGVLFCSQIGPSLSFGPSLLLPAFAAVFLGSTQISPGRINVWGTMIAIFTLATGVQGLQLVTGVQWLADMFDGTALILAVGFAVQSERRVQSARASAATPAPEPPAADQSLPAPSLSQLPTDPDPDPDHVHVNVNGREPR
jgi:ribose transport system permease protein